MEEQTNIETIGIGTKETTKLEPKSVKIVKAVVTPVGEKGAKKLVCEVKHPDKEETIQISSAKSEKNGKLEVTGLWVNLDEDKLLKKDSTLATLLKVKGCENIKALEGIESETVKDSSGYLAFKAY